MLSALPTGEGSAMRIPWHGWQPWDRVPSGFAEPRAYLGFEREKLTYLPGNPT